MAVHGVRIQVVDSHTGKVLPTEQVYRSYVALYATHPVATSADREPVHASRTLVVIGCEARDSIRLPPGYFIPSSGVRWKHIFFCCHTRLILELQNETWYLRSRLYNSWGQLSGAQRGVLFSLNVTYLPLSSALAQSMLEVSFCHSPWPASATMPEASKKLTMYPSISGGLLHFGYYKYHQRKQAQRFRLANREWHPSHCCWFSDPIAY